MSGRIKIEIDGARNNGDDGYGGALTVGTTIQLRYGSGSGSGQINRIYQSPNANLSIPVGADLDLDLQTLATAPDATLGANSIRAVLVQADSDNTVGITVKPGSVNPWLGTFLVGASQIGLGPGDFVAIGGADFPVSGASKILAFSHGGVAVQRVRVVLLAAAP